MLHSLAFNELISNPAEADYYRTLPYRPQCTDQLSHGCWFDYRCVATREPYIRPNPPLKRHWLIFDVDRSDAGAAALDAGLPDPAWIAINPKNQHAHIAYGLTEPVCCSDFAHLKPLQYTDAVERGMRSLLEADPGYHGYLTKNPMHHDWVVLWNTINGRYSLDELAEYVDLTIPRPRVASEIASLGRNCHVFEHLRDWSYRARQRSGWPDYSPWLADVSAYAHTLNVFSTPLPVNEIDGIARSVARWTYRNITPAGFSALQARRGQRGGRKSKGGGRPTNKASERQAQPWLDLGISKRTYQRRKADNRI